MAIEETEVISKCFPSFFHTSLGWEYQNPALLLSWEYPRHSTGALHPPKRNNTHPCHKCAEDYCSCLHHKPETWPRFPPSSRGSALASRYPPVKAEQGKYCKFIRETWLEMKIFKTDEIIFPRSLIFINIYSRTPLAVKAFCEKSLMGSANKVCVSVRMIQTLLKGLSMQRDTQEMKYLVQQFLMQKRSKLKLCQRPIPAFKRNVLKLSPKIYISRWQRFLTGNN